METKIREKKLIKYIFNKHSSLFFYYFSSIKLNNIESNQTKELFHHHHHNPTKSRFKLRFF